MKPFADLEMWINGLLNASLQALLLVPVILLIQWLFKKQLTARWRHALWWLLVARLLIPVSIASPLSVFNYASVNVQVTGPQHGKPTAESSVKNATPSRHELVDGSMMPATGAAADVPLNQFETTPETRPTVIAPAPAVGQGATKPVRASNWRDYLLPAIVGGWLLGVVILGLLVCRQTFGFARRLRNSEQRALDGFSELLERFSPCSPKYRNCSMSGVLWFRALSAASPVNPRNPRRAQEPRLQRNN